MKQEHKKLIKDIETHIKNYKKLIAKLRKKLANSNVGDFKDVEALDIKEAETTENMDRLIYLFDDLLEVKDFNFEPHFETDDDNFTVFLSFLNPHDYHCEITQVINGIDFDASFDGIDLILPTLRKALK